MLINIFIFQGGEDCILVAVGLLSSTSFVPLISWLIFKLFYVVSKILVLVWIPKLVFDAQLREISRSKVYISLAESRFFVSLKAQEFLLLNDFRFPTGPFLILIIGFKWRETLTWLVNLSLVVLLYFSNQFLC